jgi:hypothetical protein
VEAIVAAAGGVIDYEVEARASRRSIRSAVFASLAPALGTVHEGARSTVAAPT